MFSFMKKLFKIFIYTIIIGAILPFFLPQKASAQISSIGIATYLPISDKSVEDGDIIVTTEKGYILSTIPYDSRMTGVVTTNPAISLKNDQKKGFPVIGSGTAYVKVTGTNGSLAKGDFITSSQVRGTGMKAEGSGFVLGSALENASFAKEDDIKIVQIFINPHFVQSGLSFNNSVLDIFKIGKLAASEKPSKALQYIIAGLITLVTFGAGLTIFAKTVSTGIEAIGRNPLAGRMIQLSIVFNIFLIIVIVTAGTALAYLVIRL